MNSIINNISNENAKQASNKKTVMSISLIAFGILSLFARFQQVDTRSSLSMILLALGSGLLAFGVILALTKQKHVAVEKEVAQVKRIRISMGQVKVFAFMALIFGYILFSHFVGNLVVILK